LSINLPLARKKLLADPSIAEAEIIRYLPDRMVIRIREHRPLAVLDFGRRFIINKNGEIFKETDNSNQHDLPLITGLKVSDINISGEHGSLYYDAVMEVLNLGQKRGTPVPLGTIEKIKVDKEMGLILYAADSKTDDLHEIKLGYNDYPIKYKSLKKIYIYLKRTRGFLDFCSIDINNLNRIVLTPGGNKEEV
jgi:cell division protein FtsQ